MNVLRIPANSRICSFVNPPPRGRMVTVFCAIVGVPGSVFSVKIDENESVAELKKAIKKENPNIFQCNAMDLQLYLTKKGDVWLTEAHVKEGLRDTSGLKLLDSMKTKLKVLGLRNENDEEEGEEEGMGLVDVLVVNPQEQSFQPQNECTRVVPSEFQTFRSTLVDSVINLLFPPTGDHRPLLFFRAPPLSGKSTLCDLLCDRLAKTKPEVLVARVLATRKPSSVSFSEYFKSAYNCELDKFWDFTCDRVLLIDDAHLTYDDVFLWLGLLKNTYERRFRGPRIVLFSSYGSGRHEYNGTDFTVDGFDTFGLNGNDTKPGLQLSRPELDEMIGGSIFAQVRDLIWHLSSGHIGVAHDILSFLAEEFKNKPSESINASEMELALRSVGLMNYMLEKRGIQTYQTFERTVEKEERFRGSYLDINYLTYRTLCGEVVLSTDQTKTLAIEFLIKFGFFYEDEKKHLQFPSNMHMKIWLYSKRASSRNIVDFPQEDFVAACISKMSAGKLQRYATANMCNKTRERQIQMDLYGSIPNLPQDVLVTPEWRTNDGKGFNGLLIRGSSIFWLWELLVDEDDDVDPTKRVESLCKSYGSFTGTFKYALIDFRQNKRAGHDSDGFLYVAFEDSYKKALISGLGKPVTTVELSRW